jgi:hypothetical protein
MKNYTIQTIQRTLLALSISAGCVLSQNVKAEWLWCDGIAVDATFEKLITENLPKNCRYEPKDPKEAGSGTIPLQNNFVIEEKKEIAHQMNFNVDKQCFKKLTKKLSQLKSKNKLAVHNKTPKHLFLGDNSIIFYFDATESEIRNVKGEPCDSVKSQK